MSQAAIRALLGLHQTNAVLMCLPQFEGFVATSDGLTYRGQVRASRDVNAARHISELAFEAGADISYIAPHDGDVTVTQPSGTLVMFGSRSNVATNSFMSRRSRSNIVRFEYGAAEWSIHTQTGHRYAISDPSKLDRDTYANATDYGIVAVYHDEDIAAVVVAGLGGRATEGCGLYLREHWHKFAASRRGSRIVAAVLKFTPPVDPGRCEIVEFLAS